MKIIASLGSIFFAFIGGAIIAAGTTVVVSIFLGSDLPPFWWMMLLSGLAFIVSSVFIGRLSVQLSNLESSSLLSLLASLQKRGKRLSKDMSQAMRKLRLARADMLCGPHGGRDWASSRTNRSN